MNFAASAAHVCFVNFDDASQRLVALLGDIVEASLAGLRLGEVICIPTMEDASLPAAIEESEKRFFENTRTGQSARRYREEGPE